MADSRIQLTVPQYFKKFINSNVSLEDSPAQCCPFHKEKTPSFFYKPADGTWRCYGACKTGGGVIDLHRMNYKLKSKAEAEASLLAVLGLGSPRIKSIEEIKREPIIVDEDRVELDRIYHLCLVHANNPDRWIQMDYAMSIYPVDVVRLKDLLTEWKVNYV